MPPTEHPPRHYAGVMVSSTFKDLAPLREILIDAISRQEFATTVMENDTARAAGDVIYSSLGMVRDAAAYILLIGMKYGQIPVDQSRNPNNLSITELEFNEAQRIGRPTLLFIMTDDYPLPKSGWESDPQKEEKLNVFRERAKKSSPDSIVNRVYASFSSLSEFKEDVPHAVSGLHPILDKVFERTPVDPAKSTVGPTKLPIPAPPYFYAEPRYGGSHKFVGRQAELDILSDWASPAAPQAVLLFDAIGGTGKSMLTWEWANNHATKTRTDWAGRFWYSFYERGAIMADFCRHALAYITNRPLDQFIKLRTAELAEQLLLHLNACPWLLVLDGLERVLVAYNRYDAAELSDEDAANPTDQIAERDPCSAIRPEDDDLLRAMAAAERSKIVITSRLTPRVLVNQSGQAIAGVRRSPLPGLRPSDAEALLRSCGVEGNSAAIQAYLQENCDCHPLVVGVLGGLIQNYFPDRGNFDAWSAALAHGGALNLADHSLIQRRTDILKAALDHLSKESRQLLSTIALLSEAVDYTTLTAFNPHRPPEPVEVEVPYPPFEFPGMSDLWKALEQEKYKAALQERKDYESYMDIWRQSPEYRAMPRLLSETLLDLTDRGLLQYDKESKRYDLHPVVRNVAAGSLGSEQRENYGKRVVNVFTAKPHNRWEQAQTLDDLSVGLQVIRTLLKIGDYEQAVDAFSSGLGEALTYNFEAHPETLSLLRPFFSNGWQNLPAVGDDSTAGYLLTEVVVALEGTGQPAEAEKILNLAIPRNLRLENWAGVWTDISNLCEFLRKRNRLMTSLRLTRMELNLATIVENKAEVFSARADEFGLLVTLGLWTQAEELWKVLEDMGRQWPRGVYQPGDVEHQFARLRYQQGLLNDEDLFHAAKIARNGCSRLELRSIYQLRGQWHLEAGELQRAAESLHEAVSMARGAGKVDATAETQLTLALCQLDRLPQAREEAERLAQGRFVAHQPLANLWLAIGDRERAIMHAHLAYEYAWADGEPYVYRHELNKAKALLERLGEPIPNLPPYDPSKEKKFPWEDELLAALATLQAEKAAKGELIESENQEGEA